MNNCLPRVRSAYPRYGVISKLRIGLSESISSIEDANAWLDSFIIDFNRCFARLAKYPKDLHRPVVENSEDLDDIFAWQESRKLSKTLTFRYDKEFRASLKR